MHFLTARRRWLSVVGRANGLAQYRWRGRGNCVAKTNQQNGYMKVVRACVYHRCCLSVYAPDQIRIRVEDALFTEYDSIPEGIVKNTLSSSFRRGKREGASKHSSPLKRRRGAGVSVHPSAR